jgi:hypothetical protein
MTDVERLAPRCYFCQAPSREPVTYVKWIGSDHYGFLCEPHRAEHGEHISSEMPVEAGMNRLRAVFGE